MILYFRERLAELGWVEGRDVSITYRWADGQVARYPAIASDLVAESLDVIVAPAESSFARSGSSTPPSRSSAGATS